MSDANRSSLARVKETNYGETPATPGFSLIRFTGESLAHQKETVESQEIRPDRNTADLPQVGANAGGDISFELSAGGSFDWLYEAALMCVPTVVNQTVAVTFAAAGQTMTIDSGSWAVKPQPGMWLLISSAANSGNNGYKRVAAASTTVVTFEAGSITDDASADSVTIKGTAYVNGITDVFNTLERHVLARDGSNLYQAYCGMACDKFSVELATKAITKGSATFLGKVGDSRSAIISGATYAAATVSKVLNGTLHVGRIERNNAVLTDKLRNLSFMVENNLRTKDALGVFGAFDIGTGRCKVTGKMSSYFEDKTLLDAFLAHTYASLGALQKDDAGNAVGFFIPQAVFATGNPAVTGENTDVYQELTFQGIYDGTVGGSIVISVIAP